MKRLLVAGAAASLILAGQALAQTGTPPSEATAAPGPTNGVAAQGQAGMGKYDPASSGWQSPSRGVGVQSDPANGQGMPAAGMNGQGVNGQGMNGQGMTGQEMNAPGANGEAGAQAYGQSGGAMSTGQSQGFAQGGSEAGGQSMAMASGAPANGAWPVCSASRHDYCRQRSQEGVRTAANHHRSHRTRREREVATGM